MKLQPDKSSAPLVRACDAYSIRINDQIFTGSVLVSSLEGHAPAAWKPRQLHELDDEDLAWFTKCGAEMVILGTGARQVFAPARWTSALAQSGVGLESMDTAAACRTYNILASEGRKVVAALMLASS